MSGQTGPENGHRTFQGSGSGFRNSWRFDPLVYVGGAALVTSAMTSAPVFLHLPALTPFASLRLRFRRRLQPYGMATVLPPVVAVKR